MKTTFFIAAALLLSFGVSSCRQENCECTALAEDGTSLYTVVGQTLCEEQVDTANGEYCSCECK